MAHYAFLDENNIVQKVLVGLDENNLSELPEEFENFEEYYSTIIGMKCKRTSYNTSENQHLLGGTAYRGNFAGVGFTYDEVNDVFVQPKPYDSWIINESNWTWEAPVAFPNDDNGYNWNEETQSWDLVE